VITKRGRAVARLLPADEELPPIFGRMRAPLKSWAISLRPSAKSGTWMSSPEPAPLLLDTHYWIWMQLGEASHFTERTLTAIRQAAAGGSLLVSAISVWELGMLEAKGGFA